MRFIPSAVITTALLAVLASPACGQRRLGSYLRRAFDYRAVEIGVVGGPNRATLTGAGPVDPIVRGMLGGFVSVRLGEGFRLRPEVLVSGKNTGFTTELLPPCLPPGPCPVTREREHTALTWLEAPLLVEYRPGRFGRAVTPRMYAGPFLAIRVGCSQSVQNSADPYRIRVVRSCDEAPTTLHINNGDGGFVIGGSLNHRGVGVGLRWTRSLSEIAPRNQPLAVSRLLGAKQSVLTATLELSSRLW